MDNMAMEWEIRHKYLYIYLLQILGYKISTKTEYDKYDKIENA